MLSGGRQCECIFGWTRVSCAGSLDNRMEAQSKGYISRVSVQRGGLWRTWGYPLHPLSTVRKTVCCRRASCPLWKPTRTRLPFCVCWRAGDLDQSDSAWESGANHIKEVGTGELYSHQGSWDTFHFPKMAATTSLILPALPTSDLDALPTKKWGLCPLLLHLCSCVTHMESIEYGRKHTTGLPRLGRKAM